VTGVTPEPVTVADDVRAVALQRADASYDALRAFYYLPDTGLFRETYPDGSSWPYSYAWPLAQTLASANDLASLPFSPYQRRLDVLAVVQATEQYFDAGLEVPAYASYVLPPLGHESDRYYDDNVWLGLELLRAYRLTGHLPALERAGQVFDYLVSGWATDPLQPHAGGVYWKDTPDNRDRNTVSTAPAAKLGLRLAELERDPARKAYYLEWSLRMYEWVAANMQDADGLYWDHIRADGSFDTALFPYNQGAMIGASVLLHRATGDEAYLDRAERTASAALARWPTEQLLGQDIAFNALFFRNLLLLNAVRPDQAYLDALTAYADTIWSGYSDPQTGLHTTSQPLTLLDQAAATRLYALLAGYDVL
jgi:hypothetical protein